MTSLSQKSINNSLTRANSAEIAGFGMPSNFFEELSYPASGDDVTAPANGYFVANAQTASNGAYVQLAIRNENTVYGTVASGDAWSGQSSFIKCFVPVLKGDNVGIYYTNLTSDKKLYFVYAQGEL